MKPTFARSLALHIHDSAFKDPGLTGYRSPVLAPLITPRWSWPRLLSNAIGFAVGLGGLCALVLLGAGL